MDYFGTMFMLQSEDRWKARIIKFEKGLTVDEVAQELKEKRKVGEVQMVKLL